MSTLSQTYNDLGEPETESWSGVPLADGSSWNWEYDRLGQVIGDRKSWPDLIGHAGGLTEDAVYTRVEFVHDRVTNRFNLLRMAAAEMDDPIVPIRSVVRVRRAVE